MDKKVGDEAIYPKLDVSDVDSFSKGENGDLGQNGWVEVEVSGDMSGYVSTNYVSRITELSTAEPV